MDKAPTTFAERLQSQLILRGKSVSPTQLARDFNLRWEGEPVSTNAARKWLYGPSLPKMEKIEVLAKMLGTSPEWLRWGKTNSTSVHHASLSSASQIDQQLTASAIHDWTLLSRANKELVASIVELLLKNQESNK